MAKQGKRRTFSICLTDIPKERILIHENGKKHLNLESWDNDEPDKYDNDFSVRISMNKDEIERKKAGETITSIYLGNGSQGCCLNVPFSIFSLNQSLKFLISGNFQVVN